MATPHTPAAATVRHLAPWAGRLLVVLFVMAIVLPGLATALGLGQETQGNEAETTGTSLMARAARFDTHFAFRDRFVQVQSWLRYQLLGVSSLATVWKGRDGWWFLAADGDVEATLNEPRFTPAELEKLVKLRAGRPPSGSYCARSTRPPNCNVRCGQVSSS